MALEQKLEKFIKSHELLGRNALKSLRNQLIGGHNNAKGNQHECHFAVYQLAKNFTISLNSKVNIFQQVAAFVDDLVIRNESADTKFSFQLKDSTSVSWRGAKGIVGYFSRQHILDKYFHDSPNARTVLVLANKYVFDKLSTTIPNEIQDHTDVIYFENCLSPNKLLLSDQKFRAAIESLCVSTDLDKLEVIVQGLIGAWVTNSAMISDVAQIVRKAIEQTKPHVFKDFAEIEATVSPEFLNLIDTIDKVSYQVINGSFNYSVGRLSGFLPFRVGSPEFNLLCEKVIARQPKTAIELVQALMLVEAGD
ncbi:MAG: hypothetical protein H6999_06555 [Hahellaceae bacterium]|nr:hypothetical protein [Hahellaceae bacterium]MCP5169402.1 hypothetical protein [Hahellaceae bacterium]